MKRRVSIGLCVWLALAGVAAGEVVRVEILRREPFANGDTFGSRGAYERITGRLHYRVDPANRANARIVDLAYAPKDDRGAVVFVGDFVMLKPVDLTKGNRRILYEVNNRGNLGLLARLNLAPANNQPLTRADGGNGFLMRQGYTLLWSAWNWDVLPGDGRLQIELPVASLPQSPITGRIVSEIVVDRRSRSEPLAWGNSRCYPVADPDATDSVLTVRDEPDDPRQTIPRASWRFARDEQGLAVPDRAALWLDGGFEPGRLYELVYTAKDPRIVGLGLAAIRDTLAFFRFEVADSTGQRSPLTRVDEDGRVVPDAEHALIFGISQSGRVIQHMVWQGFHVDERGRMVFDGAMPHVAGGGKGAFNHRFAQTTRHPSEFEDHQAVADVFPFAPEPQRDPVTGQRGDLLEVAKALGHVPRMMLTGTSTEYWTRSASLVHTDVTGTRDAVIDPHVRIYFISGAQHQNTRRATASGFEHLGNPLDHSAPLRALLVALDAWVARGVRPPDSVYPRIDRGELVSVVTHRRQFPAIPGVRHPGAWLQPRRWDLGPAFWRDGVATIQPPRAGAPYVTLVPAVDADGNERGGIATPDIAVPLGTYVGWNPRSASIGAANHLARWSGSFVPLAPDEDVRQATGDPRPSIVARYQTKAIYVAAVRAVVTRLIAARLLLPDDGAAYVDQAEAAEWPPVAPGTSRSPVATLIGFAAIDPDTFAEGSESGRFRDNGRRGDAFPGQPVQGLSALRPDESQPGTWWALSDNGFGVRWNSSDYLLALYRLRPDWKTRAGGRGGVRVVSVHRLSDPGCRMPVAITREGTAERWLTGSDFDPEAFVRMADGSFWVGDEFGPYLGHFDEAGQLLQAPVGVPGLVSPDRPGLPPADAGGTGPAVVRRSRGFESLATIPGSHRLLAVLEGPTLLDAPTSARMLEFDPTSGAFTGRSWDYPLDDASHSVTELVSYAPGWYVAIERDAEQGPAARCKRVYAVRVPEAGGVVEKRLVLDLLAILDPDRLASPSPWFTFPYVTTEAVWVEDERTLVLANDNNYPGAGGRGAGLRDRTEWIRVRLGSPLPR